MGLFAGVDGAGVVPVVAMGGGAPGALTYTQRVLATGPIAYWVQAETAGTNAADQILPPLQDGTYARNVAVMGTAPGIGDGNTAPMFNGANDVNKIFTAMFQGRFNPAEGSLMAWVQVANAGVWTDGANRRAANLETDSNNVVMIYKTSVANRLAMRYRAGGVLLERVIDGLVTVNWFCAAITWSVAANEVRVYIDGVQQGAIMAGLGAWVGNLAAGTTCIGARSTWLSLPWNGNLAHVPVWDRPLTPAEVAALAVV